MKTKTLGLSLIVACLMPGLALAASYAEDRARIKNLSNRYMVAVDAGDIETVMNTWAEEGVLEWAGGTENGKDEIRDAMAPFIGGLAEADIPESATSRPRTRHQIINHVIDVDGDTANTVAYWFAMTNDTSHGQVRVLYFGHYEDELVKRDGRWLFKKRSVYNESLDNSKLFYPGLGETDPRQ